MAFFGGVCDIILVSTSSTIKKDISIFKIDKVWFHYMVNF